MDPAHLHLVVNHLPIMGAYLALPLLVLALWRRREKAALLGAVMVLTLAATGAVVSLRSGPPAEEVVEHLPDVSEPWIEEHEERAETATVLSVLTALGAIGTLAYGWRRPAGAPVLAISGVLAAALATAGAMAWTGLAGGQIHHVELRDNASAAPTTHDDAGEESEAEDER